MVSLLLVFSLFGKAKAVTNEVAQKRVELDTLNIQIRAAEKTLSTIEPLAIDKQYFGIQQKIADSINKMRSIADSHKVRLTIVPGGGGDEILIQDVKQTSGKVKNASFHILGSFETTENLKQSLVGFESLGITITDLIVKPGVFEMDVAIIGAIDHG